MIQQFLYFGSRFGSHFGSYLEYVAKLQKHEASYSITEYCIHRKLVIDTNIFALCGLGPKILADFEFLWLSWRPS